MSDIDRLESLVLRDTGRHVELLARYAAGGLAGGAGELASAPAVAVVTGFAVPTVGGALPETDGPIGAASVAGFLGAAGRKWTVVTDRVNRDVCAAALAAHDLPPLVRTGDTLEEVKNIAAGLQDDGFTHLVFIERLGPNRRGQYLSMRGVDMTSVTAPLDQLLIEGFRSIGIGDGGNEIGLGKVPADAVAHSINRGVDIHCVVPTDDLILAGVSNWGAWALVGATALSSEELRDAAATALALDTWRLSLRLAVEAGAVDGVRLASALSVDGLEPEIHDAVLNAIRVVSGLP